MNLSGYAERVTILLLNVHYCILFSIIVRVRIRVKIRIVSGCLGQLVVMHMHSFVLGTAFDCHFHTATETAKSRESKWIHQFHSH